MGCENNTIYHTIQIKKNKIVFQKLVLKFFNCIKIIQLINCIIYHIINCIMHLLLNLLNVLLIVLISCSEVLEKPQLRSCASSAGMVLSVPSKL